MTASKKRLESVNQTILIINQDTNLTQNLFCNKYLISCHCCVVLASRYQVNRVSEDHYPPAWLAQVTNTPKQLIKHFLQEVTLQALEVPQVLAPCQNGLQCYERYTQPPLANKAAWQALVH